MDSGDAKKLAGWLQTAKSVVVFTGAGVSTESGIPDFRSPSGVWSKYRTVYYNDFMASPDERYEYWRQKAEAHRDFADAKPNAGHQAIAKWEQSSTIRGVITQNIDGLHQLAGNQNVLELHGTARRILCQDCGARFDAAPLVAQFLAADCVPECVECSSGRMKHATISFGQALPANVLDEAAQWCREADLLLAIGSSLVVSPAADLPAITKHSGGRLVIINREATPLDGTADLVIRAAIGEVLSTVDEHAARVG